MSKWKRGLPFFNKDLREPYWTVKISVAVRIEFGEAICIVYAEKNTTIRKVLMS